MRYGSACKHMYYLAKQYNMLVVENVTQFVNRRPLNSHPHVNLNEWLPDSSFRREKSPVVAVSTGLSVAANTQPSKKRRPNNPQSKGDLDADDPLMTE